MRIVLSADRRVALLQSIRKYFAGEFEEPISDFRAEGLLDFFLKELGPHAYNQGVKDATSFMQEKLGDIEGDVYLREDER